MSRIDVELAQGLPRICFLTGARDAVEFHDVKMQQLPSWGSPVVAVLVASFGRRVSRGFLYRSYRLELPFSPEGVERWKSGERAETIGTLSSGLVVLAGVGLMFALRDGTAMPFVVLASAMAAGAIAFLGGKVARASAQAEAPRLLAVDESQASFDFPREDVAEAVRAYQRATRERAQRKSAAMRARLGKAREEKSTPARSRRPSGDEETAGAGAPRTGGRRRR